MFSTKYSIALVELLSNLIADEDSNLQFGNRNFPFFKCLL